MVHIEIDKDTAIECTIHGWQICKKSIESKTGKVTWPPHSFYATLDACMNGLLQRKIRTSDARSIVELVDVVKKESAKIRELCRPMEKL